jgi:hypothetical protein
MIPRYTLLHHTTSSYHPITTTMTTLRAMFCACTQPNYLPDDEPELIWSNTSSKTCDRRESSAPYQLPQFQTLSQDTNNHAHDFFFQEEVPLRRSMASIDTHTTVTMNTISFDGQNWDDDEEDDDFSVMEEARSIPALALSKPVRSIDDSGCASIAACSYASTALIRGGYDLEDDDESTIVVRISESASPASRSNNIDTPRRRELPQAWSW